MQARDPEIGGIALISDEVAGTAVRPRSWLFDHTDALRGYDADRGIYAPGKAKSLPVNDDHVVRLSHRGQLTVWLLDEDALQEMLLTLSDRDLISRAEDDMAFEDGQDALTVLPAGEGLPRQWHIHDGIEAAFDVIGAEPLMHGAVDSAGGAL